MKFTHIAAALSIAAFSMSASAETLNIEGRILGATCKVAVEGSNTMTVTLDDVAPSAFTGTGTFAGSKDFSFRLTDCGKLSSIRAVFDSGTNVTAGGFLANTDTAGATGVEIALFNKGTLDGAPINLTNNANNPAWTILGQQPDGSYLVPYAASYRQAGTAAPTAGAVKTSVEFTMAYQ